MTSDHFYSQKKYIYEYIKNARDFLLWGYEPGLNQLLHRRESWTGSLLWDPVGSWRLRTSPPRPPQAL